MKRRRGRITRLWLAMIEVSDMDKAVEFYCDILGLPIALDARAFNHVEVGPEEPLAKIGLHLTDKKSDEKETTGVVFDTDDIHALYERLKEQGVVFTQEPLVEIPTAPTIPGVAFSDVDKPPKDDLTVQEKLVLTLLSMGCNTQDMTEQLVVSKNTLKSHLRNIYRKINVTDRTQAAIWAIRHGYGPYGQNGRPKDE